MDGISGVSAATTYVSALTAATASATSSPSVPFAVDSVTLSGDDPSGGENTVYAPDARF